MTHLSRRKLALHIANRLERGDESNVAMKELAAYLIDSGRTREAELVIRDIEAALANAGSVYATVTAARSLSDESKQALHDFIAAKTGAKTVSFEEKVDPSLIGGVKIEYPGHQLDMTVKAKLDKLTTK